MEWPIIYWTGNTRWGVSSKDTSSTRLAELAYSSWLDQYHLAFERRFQSVFEVLLGNTTWPFRRFAIEDLLWNTSILHSDRWPYICTTWYSLHGMNTHSGGWLSRAEWLSPTTFSKACFLNFHDTRNLRSLNLVWHYIICTFNFCMNSQYNRKLHFCARVLLASYPVDGANLENHQLAYLSHIRQLYTIQCVTLCSQYKWHEGHLRFHVQWHDNTQCTSSIRQSPYNTMKYPHLTFSQRLFVSCYSFCQSILILFGSFCISMWFFFH